MVYTNVKIKINIQEVGWGGMDWRRVIVNAVMSPRIHKIPGI
jgi:hypothetical protein